MTSKFKTKAAADAAARRELRKMFGASYMPKSGVDFIVSRSFYHGHFYYSLMVCT